MTKTAAFICPPLQGHINPMSAIAYKLKERNINVLFIGLLDAAKYLEEFKFIPIGKEVFPKGSIKKITKKMAKLKGFLMARVWQSKFSNKWSDVVCNELPAIIEREEIDFIICDQLEAATALVADHLKILFITVCNAMTIVMHEIIPPFFVSWDYKTTERRLKTNRGFYTVTKYILNYDTRVVEKWRKKWGMPERNGMKRHFAYSTVATLCQQTKSLEFPLTEINKDWCYCGPFRNGFSSSYPMPNLPNDNIKNVYISLGSILGSRYRLLKKCAKACKTQGLRPIIVHAGLLNSKKVKKLEKIALLFDYLKQPDIFKDCEILISHCGLNTALDALTYGRPIIAIPIGIEQGAIATKLKRAGCAIVLKRSTKKKIQNALSELLSNPQYIENSRSIMEEINSAGGTEKAVDIIYNIVQEKPEKYVEVK